MSPAAVVSSAGTGELLLQAENACLIALSALDTPYRTSIAKIGGLPADGLCQHACSRVKSHTTGLQPITLVNAPATAL
jgi:hypothetical protein